MDMMKRYHQQPVVLLLKDRGITKVLKYGIAFCGKQVVLV